ncbi:MAG: PAS domain-containing sensor histidine kinase, partial [Planctomycetes bacterium]|nr:PAS domain-containing sensor histidine kinase [Planctomycetota bacterium]
RMFEAFYTTRPEGLGLGLAIARTIVEAHHGRLEMTGNDGSGVTFRFTLPATGPSAGGGDA